jgi:hypothetical protein
MEKAIKVLCKELRLVTNENQALKIGMVRVEALSDNHGLEMKRLADTHVFEMKALSDNHGLEMQALTDTHELKSDALLLTMC